MIQVTHKYDDIIDLPHHVSDRHPQMPLMDRAAQFSPFAALTGFEEVLKETEKLFLMEFESNNINVFWILQ